MSRVPLSALAYLAGLLSGAIVLVATLIVVLMASASTPVPASSDELAARFGVTIFWADACGGAAGCFRPWMPDVITVRPGLGDVERSVVLHELAHVFQHRAGVPFDECDADAIARMLGATASAYDC